MRRFILIFLIVCCLLATASCLPQPLLSARNWSYADLRWLGPAGVATPATDLIAVYTHTTVLSVDIRVDLLDINPGDRYMLKLSFWDDGNFVNNPLLIDISSTGAVHTTTPGNGKLSVWPRVIQDFDLDDIVVSINRAFIGTHYHFNVSTYTTDPLALADGAQDIRFDGNPPAQRAPVLVEFWNSFPAATPAQALRLWDGAHTGPLGDRHGLVNIVNGARKYHVPIALLDIKTPASLAALDYLGETWELQNLYDNGLVILPDVAYSKPSKISLNFSRRAAAGFDLPESQFVYSASSELVTGYRAQFVVLTDSTHLANSGGTRLIPVAAAQTDQPTQDGPTLDVRRALVAAALSSDPTDLVVLGGNLPDSNWGDVDIASPTFAWIAAHPWIHPLTGDDLMAFPIGAKHAVPLSNGQTPLASSFLVDLQAAPDNGITRSAWNTYLTLTAPSENEILSALQSQYLGQVGSLLAASHWAEHPAVQADCSGDPDRDGQPECILANQKYFAVLEPDGGRLTNLFYLDTSGPHQLVAPSSQFTVGLSDPSEWHPELGEAADPSVIPGAFADDTDTWATYPAKVSTDDITFANPDGSRIKTYRLTDHGLQVDYQEKGSTSTQIPVVVDPQTFYSGPTKYQPALGSHVWTWSLVNGISVQVSTDADLTAQGFTSSYPFLVMPEDPNLDYPKGHYYPFPLSVVAIQGNGDFQVEIAGDSNK